MRKKKKRTKKKVALWDGDPPTDEELLMDEIGKLGKASMRHLLKWRGYMSKKCL